MTNETLETIGRILAIIIGTSTVMLGFAKYIALPWLKENLVKPVEEVNTQVTTDGIQNADHTMLDSVQEIESKVESLGETVHKIALDAAHIGAATGLIQKMWDHHLDWSTEEVKRIWAAIDKLDHTKKDKHDDTE